MNILTQLTKTCRVAAFLAATIMTWSTINANAADTGVKGNPQYKWAPWAHIETLADAEAVEAGDSIAMACPKCKTISVTLVTQDTKTKTKLVAGEKHLCPGCNSSVTVVGSKAHNKQVLKHVCKVCGDESAFCCVTKPGGDPTKGMEKDKVGKKL
jgi:hypothetical protein